VCVCLFHSSTGYGLIEGSALHAPVFPALETSTVV